MQLFQVTAAEAFLLGVALGVAEQTASKSRHLPEFGYPLHRILGPFVPQMPISRQVALDKLPDDAVEIEDGVYRSSVYESISRTENGLIGTLVNNSRRSLIQLVKESIAHQIEKDLPPAPDKQDGPNASPAADLSSSTREEWLESLSKIEMDGIGALINEHSRSALPSVSRVLRQLAVDNCCVSEFDDGRVFGNYQRHLEVTAEWAHSLPSADKEYESAQAKLRAEKLETVIARITDERDRLFEALLATRVLHECPVAREVILYMESQGPCAPGVVDDDIIDSDEFVDRVNDATQAYWIGVGIIWKHLQDRPHETSERLLPRLFLTRPATNLTFLRTAMEAAYQALHSPRSDATPAEVVMGLVYGVEPLVKSLWPTTTCVTDVLQRQLRDSRDVEILKFSSIALCLFKTYRNTAVHDGHTFHTFVSTWNEAQFVYNGMCTVLDLHDRISARQQSSGQQS